MSTVGGVSVEVIVLSSIAGVFGILISVFVVNWNRQNALYKRLRRQTRLLSDEEIIELQVNAPNWKELQLRRLYKKYINLDEDRSGTITQCEFSKLDEVKYNPLAHRIFDAFDTNDDGHLDFREFVNCVSVMSESGQLREKMSALFRIFDVDGDGKVGKEDLKTCLELCALRPQTKEELKGVAKKEETDEDLIAKQEEQFDNFLDECVEGVMNESSSAYKNAFLSPEDFSRALAVTRADFADKMNIRWKY